MTSPLGVVALEAGRVYGKTTPDTIAWTCPDCGALIEFWHGRRVHDRFHRHLDNLRGDR